MFVTSVRFSRTDHDGALESISNRMYPEKKKNTFLYHAFNSIKRQPAVQAYFWQADAD